LSLSKSKKGIPIAMDGASIGPVVGVAFGCAWGIAGATALPTRCQDPAVISCIGVSVALTVFALSRKQCKPGIFSGRTYGMAILFESAAILGTVYLLRQSALSQLLMPAVGFIVGLHFLGLWKATDLRVFLWVALAMCLVCGAAAFLPVAGANGNVDLRRVEAGLGSALVLWRSSAWSSFEPN